MRLSIEQIVRLIGFIRAAEAAGCDMNDIEAEGTGDQGCSSDGFGEDPYFDTVSLVFVDDEDQEHVFELTDATCHQAFCTLGEISRSLSPVRPARPARW